MEFNGSENKLLCIMDKPNAVLIAIIEVATRGWNFLSVAIYVIGTFLSVQRPQWVLV